MSDAALMSSRKQLESHGKKQEQTVRRIARICVIRYDLRYRYHGTATIEMNDDHKYHNRFFIHHPHKSGTVCSPKVLRAQKWRS